MIGLVTIISYGTGNLASLNDAFEAVGARCCVATTEADLRSADALVLPGIGHFGQAMRFMRGSGLLEPTLSLIRSGVPTLGICLGFQLLTLSSEESDGEPGLGILPMHTVRIRPADKRHFKVPHLGWNTVEHVYGEPSLLRGIEPAQQTFYYANAYGVSFTESVQPPLAIFEHGGAYVALIEQGSVFGAQFHPEKSRVQGRVLLRNFLES
jgi:glutamine amidotransferase